MPSVRVLIVDDNPLFLETTRELLQGECDVVGMLNSGIPVVSTVASLKPDVVVLDISLGGITGFEVARQLTSVGSNANVVFLTIHEGAQFVNAAASLGVAGYVYKSHAVEDLVKAVKAAVAGKKFFPKIQQ